MSNNVTARRVVSGGINWLLRSKEPILSSNQQTLHCVQGDITQLLDTLLDLTKLSKNHQQACPSIYLPLRFNSNVSVFQNSLHHAIFVGSYTKSGGVLHNKIGD